MVVEIFSIQSAGIWVFSLICCVLLAKSIRLIPGCSPSARDAPPANTITKHEHIQPNDETRDKPATDAATRKVVANGSYGLQVVHEDNDATVDIVGVHGLGANPDHAWLWHKKNNPTHGNLESYPTTDVNWLQDLLPSKLRSDDVSCRVMVFNHDSRWIRRARIQRLSHISNRMLDSLHNKRGNSHRPLIFVAHSFGGNLVEQAIVDANSPKSDWHDIARSTAGVLFLGTPHRGCNAARWGAMIAAMLQRGLGSEPTILRSLENPSDRLTNLLDEFTKWLWIESVPVICYFENKVTNYVAKTGLPFNVPTLVVDELSACIDGHKKMPLDADHFKINKFWGLQDPSFDLVYHDIKRMAQGAAKATRYRRNLRKLLRTLPEELPRKGRSGEFYQCLREMAVTNPWDLLNDLWVRKGRRVEHTCKWILDQPAFIEWRVSNKPELLRLIGLPGMGKTMLSTFLIEILEHKVRRSPDKLFAFFICDDKIKSQNSPQALLRSIIWQLLLQKNDLFKHVQEDYKLHGKENCFKKVSSLWRMLQNMVQDPLANEVFVLIDALDECDLSRREGLLMGLHDLFDDTLTLKRGVFKFILTCRPDIHDIEARLYRVSKSLEMDSTMVKNDLARYIDSRVDELAGCRPQGYHPREKVRKVLRQGHGGTFLWVSLMIADLKETLKHEVMDKLANPLPKELPKMYRTILSRIPQERRGDVRFILHLLVAAARPLSRIEIMAAFVAWNKHTAPVSTSTELDIYTDIFSSTGSIILNVAKEEEDKAAAALVGFKDQGWRFRNRGTHMKYWSKSQRATINFCHQSVKDYLCTCPKTEWYHVPPNSVEAFELEVCWRYLAAKNAKHERVENQIYRRRHGGQKPTGDSVGTSVSYAKKEDEVYQLYPFLTYTFDCWCPMNWDVITLVLQSNIEFKRTPILRDLLFLTGANYGGAELLKLMQRHGSNVNVSDESGRTALLLAFCGGGGSEEMIENLLKNGADVNHMSELDKMSALSYASREGSSSMAKLLVRYNAEIDSKDLEGRTPLYHAASTAWFEEHSALVEFLLGKGADVNSNSAPHKKTPLHAAVKSGSIAMVTQLLLEPNINVEARTHCCRTALHYACRRGHREIAELLLGHDAQLGIKDSQGHTPLMSAIRKGELAVIDTLSERYCMTAEEGELALKLREFLSTGESLRKWHDKFRPPDPVGSGSMSYVVTDPVAPRTYKYQNYPNITRRRR